MNEGLDDALVLPEAGEKPSIQYRTSAYTVRQYCALPYAQRRAVDVACDEAAGLSYTRHTDESSPQPYTIGRATRPADKGARQVTIPPTTTSTTLNHMTTPVHPAPSAALHTLNTPEAILHDTTHPDNLGTFAALAEATAQAATPAPPVEPLAHDGTVYETTDYGRFHLLPENRAIDPKQVRKLVAAIHKSNLLHLRPVDVTPTLGIIDGQHRWAAAKELGLPIFYKVGEQLGEADITTLNVTQKNWQGTDYLHYWTVKGRPSYVKLTAFMERHPTLSFSNAKMMLGGSANNRAEEFRAGNWLRTEATRDAEAEQVAGLVERIGAEVKSFKSSAHTGFVAALYYCVASVEGFDAKEMMRTILMQPLSLVPCASHKQWLQMLSNIYNYRKNDGNKIRFE